MTSRTLALAALAAFAAPAAAQFGYDIVSYHGVTHAAHQASANNLGPQGYRPISLTVAGGWANAHYAAVWLRQAGPAWVSSHGMSESQYTTQHTTWLAAGFRPKVVSASGNGVDKVFAAVFVQDGVATQSPINQSSGTFEADATNQRNGGWRMVSCAQYGTATSPLFAPVYEQVDDTAWGWEANDTGTEFNDHIAAHGDGENRPAFVSMSDYGRHVSIWHDDRVGNWAWVGGRTAAQFTADKVAMDNAGLVPLCIAAGGAGANARFAGVFVQRLTPYARTLTHSGPASLPLNAFDQLMDQHVVDNRIRGAAVAVIQDGRLVHARGYNFAEPGYPATTPTSLFRIGSISKAVCGTLAHDLIEHGVGGLSLASNFVNTLGITTHVPAMGNVNLQQLMSHTSGMVNAFDELAAAAWWNPGNPQMPPDESVIVRYAAINLGGTPAGQWAYSNAGNTAIGQMCEQVTGQPYMTVLQNRLLAPLGITRFGRMQGPRSTLLPGEVHYHLRQLYLRSGNLHTDQRLLAPQYAQRFWDCAGGVVTSAVDLARIVAGSFQIGSDSPVFTVPRQNAILARGSYPAASSPSSTARWTDGAWGWRPYGIGQYEYFHDGAQDGFRTLTLFRDNGTGVVAFCNGDAQFSLDALGNALDAVTTWPTHDLFPQHGLPSFPRTPQFVGFHTTSLPNVTKQAFTFSGRFLDQVTSVQFGTQTLPVGFSTAWENGYVELVSPTQLRVHPPQGLAPGSYTVRAFSSQGGGNHVSVQMVRAPAFDVAVQDYVLGGAMPFSVIGSQGQLSTLSWAALAFSESNLPSVAPGIVSLGLGGFFSSVVATDLQYFAPTPGTVRWDFPGLAGYGDTYFQLLAIDFLAPQQFPLQTSPVVMLDRW
jgi:CubicO group peptidase (beta-lactamase class C family)